MNIEDIKVGETYYVRVKVNTIGENYIRVTPILQGGVLSTYWPTTFALGESSAFFPIPLENGTKNSDPAPKYDPCRMFRKGDKVRVVKCNGRIGSTSAPVGMLAIVTEDEKECSWIYLTTKECDYSIDPAYLELITTVEEQEPYCIADHIHGWIVYKDNPGNVVANFNKTHPHAKAAAKAECARLNAEHRKENA